MASVLCGYKALGMAVLQISPVFLLPTLSGKEQFYNMGSTRAQKTALPHHSIEIDVQQAV